jgi:hypothetical protein
MKRAILRELVGESATKALAVHSRGFDNVHFCHPDLAYKKVTEFLADAHISDAVGLVCEYAETGEKVLDRLREELPTDRRYAGRLMLKFGPPVYVLPFEGAERSTHGRMFKYILVVDDRL